MSFWRAFYRSELPIQRAIIAETEAALGNETGPVTAPGDHTDPHADGQQTVNSSASVGGDSADHTTGTNLSDDPATTGGNQQRSTTGRSARSGSGTDDLAEFEALIAPLSKEFRQLDKMGRHGTRLLGFGMLGLSLVGLVASTATGHVITGPAFFALGVYGLTRMLTR